MMRNGTNKWNLELAEQLMAYEDSLAAAPAAGDAANQSAIARLLPSLLPLVGKAGFCSLLARALTLAKREHRALCEVLVRQDCTLEGLPADAATGVATVMAHLIGLMTTFMGETLTLRLLRNAWPDMPALQNNSVEQMQS